ncbi:MAG: class I SAM-dependent methyltransferase [Paludibacter sp.]|jgi:ubiquinone/menaquinone biosynthesis C-methylase UbiE|nr:class I SAM-dependent methyltransferase [Paludibacter sp.]
MKKNTTRWDLAQNYEYHWWKSKENKVKPNYYQHGAEEIRNYYNQQSKITSSTAILEVGSGALGVVTFLAESQERYAIDPLEHYYSSVPEFIASRDKNVKYFNCKGENLPFDSHFFDLIIMDNVLDHCENPEQVMSEMIRVAKKSGFVFFRQNTYTLYGKLFRKLMELFLIDKGHPYTFTKQDITKLFEKHKLKVLSKKRNGYFYTWKAEILSKSLKDKVKALLFVTRDRATYFLSIPVEN